MWKHCCLFVCALVALVLGADVPLSAQDPSSQPLVNFADLTYIGAFRLPRAAINGDDLSFGGHPFTFDPARNAIFVGSNSGRVAEVSIPSLVNSTDINSMFFANYVQGFVDPLEGNLWQVATSGADIEGLVVDGDKLYGTAAIYYDANNVQRVSHYGRSSDLSRTSFVGMVPVWQPDHLGFVAGYMGMVPPEWQAKLGGRAITGQCCTPIAWKTSWGPSAFAWNPADIGTTSLVPATPLLYYPNDHPTLGQWSATGAAYGATARMNGVAVIAGTRTALFFGSIGVGPPCYGIGTNNQSLNGTPTPDGTIWCYDPTSTDKGSHAYPYRYQIWAYDLNDFVAVKEGRKQPWDILPYGVWPFDLPTPEVHAKLGGIAYDAQRQVLYISQLLSDTDTFANRALIHALKIGGAPTTLPTPSATTGPTPSGSGLVKGVTLSANKPSPQVPGTTITWAAAPSGGVTPYEYKWALYDGTKWTYSAWTSSNSYAWTPTTASPYYRVSVWARSYGATADVGEATAEVYYTISGTATTATPPSSSTPPPTTTSRLWAVTLATDKVAPQGAGSAITFSATPNGGATPQQYKWLLHDGSSWRVVGDWSTSNTFAWTPTAANSQYRFGVWVRSAGNTVDAAEATSSVDFPINTSAPSTAAPPPTSTAPPPSTPISTGMLTAVTLSANRVAPQPAGTAITFSAVPNGGAAPQEYKWLKHDGQAWSIVGNWSTASTFTWTPTSANSQYRFGVWVRSAGNAVDAGQATASMDFPVGAATATPAAPPPPTTTTTAAKLSAVVINANLPAPRPAGTLITFTATPNGGVTPQQYKWLLHDGRSWQVIGDWSTSNTFNWTATLANSQYRIGVWVRGAGNTVDAGEATMSMDFPISASTTTSAPLPPPTGGKLTGVTLGANLVAPQLLGATITWTALPSGGVTPYQYQWWTFDGASWISTPWTTSNTFAWRPITASSGSRVAVWVRSAGSTGTYETSAEQFFAIWAAQ